MSTPEKTLRFVSWNTRGIKKTIIFPKKFDDVLHRLESLKADIVFIQETHIGPKYYQILENVHNWKTYFTIFRPRSKGVSILISNYVEFEYICHDEDHSGSYVVLFCRLFGELYTLVNVYNHKYDRNVLPRLIKYLQETAQGVLVIGGDFNTVLHPDFDRRGSAVHAEHSPIRHILENFMSSLNLQDIWSHLHSTEEGFTRSQNESYSRLDMFLMPTDTVQRVCACEVNKIESKQKKISDHDPLVLTLRVQMQAQRIIPRVFEWLKDYNYVQEPDRRSEKISGEEILSAIKSLTYLEEKRPDGIEIEKYKQLCCSLIEILKLYFNYMLKTNTVPERFKESFNPSGDRYIFNVDYLIFTLILRRRLSVYLSLTNKRQPSINNGVLIKVTFAEVPKEIMRTFLKTCLKTCLEVPKSLKSIHPRNFNIFRTLLPKVKKSRIRLVNGCPLTTTIHNLALKYLEVRLKKYSKVRVCLHRQTLLILTSAHTDSFADRYKKIQSQIEDFEKKSAIKLKYKIVRHLGKLK